MFIFYKENLYLSKIGWGFCPNRSARNRPGSAFRAGQDIIYGRPYGRGIDMEIQGPGKIVIMAGVVLTAVGVLMLIAPKLPFIGKLPGDFYFKKAGVSFYFPLATSVIVSIVLSILLSFFFREK